MSISSEIFDQADLIAQHLEKFGMKLEPNNGHFEHLCSFGYPVQNWDDVVPSYESSDLASNTDFTFANGDSHAEHMDSFVQLYTKTIVKRLEALRTRVLPFIDRVYAECARVQTSISYSAPEVIPISLPSLYTNPQFIDYMKRYRPVNKMTMQMVELRGGFIERDESEILSLIRTGSTKLDDVILDLIAEYPSNWLVETYKRSMLNGEPIALNIDVIRDRETVDRAIITYLLYAGIIARDVVDGTVGLKLEEYQKYLTETYVNLGGVVNQYIYKVLMFEESGRLFAYMTPENQIYVFEPVYRKFLNEGGDIEALFRAAEVNLSYTKDNILQDQQKLVNEYQAQYQSRMDTQRAMFKRNLLKVFAGVFIIELQKEDDEFVCWFSGCDGKSVFEIGNITPDVYAKISSTLCEYLDQYSSADIYELISCTIVKCGLRIWHFDSIFSRLTAIMKEHPEMNPREAMFEIILTELPAMLCLSHIDVTRG